MVIFNEYKHPRALIKSNTIIKIEERKKENTELVQYEITKEYVRVTDCKVGLTKLLNFFSETRNPCKLHSSVTNQG